MFSGAVLGGVGMALAVNNPSNLAPAGAIAAGVILYSLGTSRLSRSEEYLSSMMWWYNRDLSRP